ncbi:MAG: hypothetical protein M3R11_05560 [Acidobacteriota bacterium]|nr:hypothetical protein [Acidobacteriota bacterium]
MKNLKNMLSAASLMAVMVFGAVSANAGLLISDRATNTSKGQCTIKGGFLQELAGIIILGAPSLNGIIILGAPECTEKDGLLISDRSGLLISD